VQQVEHALLATPGQVAALCSMFKQVVAHLHQQVQTVILHANIWKQPQRINQLKLCGRLLHYSATHLGQIWGRLIANQTVFIQTQQVKTRHGHQRQQSARVWRILTRHMPAYRMVVVPVVLRRAHMP
jgi:disulfide bond formation protein DsbB